MPFAGDHVAEALVPGRPLGLLGIELPTRRRNRANGRIATVGESGFLVAVEQSFGNCPKYIVRRDYLSMAQRQAVTAEAISSLGADARDLIAKTSTFFVASSAGPNALADVSHRGGQPGFISLEADGTLTIPDYAGNNFFNTLGNLLVNPAAGLLFPDFETGDLLQLTGTAELVLDADNPTDLPGAQGLWRFHADAGQWLHGALALTFGPGELSQFSPRLDAEARRGAQT
jgi:predicted pyridoxine 5'-phosphate oxidase superfamily flavin-nucleotide-binding protein